MILQDRTAKKGRLLLATFFGICCHLQLFATHLVGGEMFYNHLGGDQYEVHLIIYRDCGPTNTNGTGFDLSAAIGVYQSTTLYSTGTMDLDFNAVTNIDLLSGNPCAVLPPGVCIERAEYISTLTLPASDQAYTIVYQRCCRNPQVINLVDATNTGFTMFTEVPAVNSGPNIDTESNSSARFTELPQAYVCQGQPFQLFNLATDPDGDSLLYSIGDVFIGGSFSAPTPNPPTGPPFPNVNWDNGYGPLTPLGSDAASSITIDPSNGTLVASPSVVGKYTVGIYVTELRQNDLGNWEPMGKVIRDFTIDVVPCEVLFPDVSWPDPCTGLDVSFGVNANTGNFLWTFGPDTETDLSTEQNPSHSFEEQGVYDVSLVYDLGGCADSLTQTITVSPFYSAEFNLGPMSCLSQAWSQSIEYTGDSPSSSSLSWVLNGETIGEGTEPGNLTIPPGTNTLTTVLTNALGCEFNQEEDLELPPLPIAAFAPSEPPCNGLEIEYTNLSTGADEFAWTFNLDVNSSANAAESQQSNPTWTFSDYGNILTQLIAQPGEACADTLVQEISVLPSNPLVMAFGAIEPLACSLETTVDFNFYGAYADQVEWDFGAEGVATGDTVVFDFQAPGLYSVTLTIENDTCNTFLSEDFEVFVPDLVSEVELLIPNVITPNADGKNDRFRVGTKRVDNGEVIAVNSSSFTQFKLQVFNRWGVLIHASEGVGAGWDGRVGGEVAAPGTYYYILEAGHSCIDEDLREVGEVTLIVD